MGANVRRSDRLKGARFGAHEIVRLIGHGATASVYEAQHMGLAKAVAIKVLHEHLASDETIAARFVREGRVAAKLAHPNAIDVLDVGVEDGVPYLVTELLRGGDLRLLIGDAGALPVEHAMAIVLPLAAALQHAHDVGVLHRDLKPANIFLARNVRGDVVPKLLDFGLSKVVEGDDGGALLTKSELVAGTVLYMAPEQTQGVRFAAPASDQYALGAVLYECLTGVPAFAADGTVYELIERIRTTSPPAPSARRAGIPVALDAIVLRAMARDPTARFESVRALGRALLPFASEETRRHYARDFVSGEPGATSSRSTPVAMPVSDPHAETRTEVPPAATSSHRIARLPCAPGASPFHIKGLFYKGFIAQVTQLVGLDRFCQNLGDPDLAAFVRQPFLASGRYDIFPFVPLNQVLARTLGMSLDELVRGATAAQARYDAKHVYRLIFDSQHPEQLADRVSRFNTQIYDFGTFGGHVPEPHHIVIEFKEIPAFLQPWFGPMHVVYASESLRISGAHEVVVMSHVARDAGTREGYSLLSFRTEFRWR